MSQLYVAISVKWHSIRWLLTYYWGTVGEWRARSSSNTKVGGSMLTGVSLCVLEQDTKHQSALSGWKTRKAPTKYRPFTTFKEHFCGRMWAGINQASSSNMIGNVSTCPNNGTFIFSLEIVHGFCKHVWDPDETNCTLLNILVHIQSSVFSFWLTTACYDLVCCTVLKPDD